MKCAICDTEDENITYDYTTHSFTDCAACREVITEAVATYEPEDEDDETILLELEADDDYLRLIYGG